MAQTRATNLEAHGIVLNLFVHVLLLLNGHRCIVQPVRKHWDEEGPYRVTMKHYKRTPGAYGKTSRFTTKCLIN